MRADQAVRICGACEEFERRWIKGETPRIEDYLEAAAPEDRPQLLEDLLRIELEWRPPAGDRPTWVEYARQFSGEADLTRATVAALCVNWRSPTTLSTNISFGSTMSAKTLTSSTSP
jgi:hypothetical protein